jgi:hypothetical protein
VDLLWIRSETSCRTCRKLRLRICCTTCGKAYTAQNPQALVRFILFIHEKVERKQKKRNNQDYTDTVVHQFYSAFYDNRSSLMSPTSQIVIVAVFKTQIDWCLIWSKDNASILLKAQTVVGRSIDQIIFCKLPKNMSGDAMPRRVSLASG